MKYKLSDICSYVKERLDNSYVNNRNYISTENMISNKGGISVATSLPDSNKVQAYSKNDILISNIRPYFKKIWLADMDGGCSNDVLVFRANENVDPVFLYYVLADDAFYDYSMSTSKGTKMPRGDKRALMNYQVPNFALGVQIKIAKLLSCLDQKIKNNNAINKNLAA